MTLNRCPLTLLKESPPGKERRLISNNNFTANERKLAEFTFLQVFVSKCYISSVWWSVRITDQFAKTVSNNRTCNYPKETRIVTFSSVKLCQHCFFTRIKIVISNPPPPPPQKKKILGSLYWRSPSVWFSSLSAKWCNPLALGVDWFRSLSIKHGVHYPRETRFWNTQNDPKPIVDFQVVSRHNGTHSSIILFNKFQITCSSLQHVKIFRKLSTFGNNKYVPKRVIASVEKKKVAE